MIRWPALLDEWESQFEDEVMPDIMPAKGDAVSVTIGDISLEAKIGSKTPDGSYEIVLSGEPIFRATIKIPDYDWMHETKTWARRMVLVPAKEGPMANQFKTVQAAVPQVFPAS